MASNLQDIHSLATGTILFLFLIKGTSQLILTAMPDLTNLRICPGLVQFTCASARAPLGLSWVINGSVQESYIYLSSDTLPKSLNINFPSPLPGVELQIISAHINGDRQTVNIRSTLTGNATVLRGLAIECVALTTRSGKLTVNVRGMCKKLIDIYLLN